MNNWALFPSGQLYLGQSSHLQVFPPVSSWLSQQEVQRPSFRKQSIMCGWGAQVWTMPWSWARIFVVLSLKFVKTDPLLNINQNKLKSSICERASVVFWSTLMKGSLTYCWAVKFRRALEMQSCSVSISSSFPAGAGEQGSVSVALSYI